MNAEEALIAEYNAQKEAFDKITNYVSDYFWKLLQEALKEGDLVKAKEIMMRCPDHVTGVFIWDAIKQFKKELKNA